MATGTHLLVSSPRVNLQLHQTAITDFADVDITAEFCSKIIPDYISSYLRIPNWTAFSRVAVSEAIYSRKQQRKGCLERKDIVLDKVGRKGAR